MAALSLGPLKVWLTSAVSGRGSSWLVHTAPVAEQIAVAGSSTLTSALPSGVMVMRQWLLLPFTCWAAVSVPLVTVSTSSCMAAWVVLTSWLNLRSKVKGFPLWLLEGRFVNRAVSAWGSSSLMVAVPASSEIWA